MTEHIDIDHTLIDIRHHLHAHPERSFREFETTVYLEGLLREHGIAILDNPMETGVVGLIEGQRGDGPHIFRKIPDSTSHRLIRASCTVAVMTCT